MDLFSQSPQAALDAAREAGGTLPPRLSGLNAGAGAGIGSGGPGATQFRDLAQARAAAEDFESFYLSQMMQPMFSGLSSEPPFGGGHAESTWRSLLVDEYGKIMVKGGGVGIADAVMRTMLQAQSEAAATNATV